MTWSITEDILPWLGFTAAFIAILMVPVRPGGAVSHGAKWFFLASVGTYMVGTTASIYGHFATRSDPTVVTIVDAVEVLWIPFLLFGVYSLYARQQLNDALAAQDAVLRTGEMMASIVETTPAGILVLDGSGVITFANDAARHLLDLTEDPDLGSLVGPGWTVTVGEHTGGMVPQKDLRALVGAEPVSAMPMVVEWPNGWRRRLAVNIAPVTDHGGRITGAVAAFLEHEPWRVVPH